MAKITCPKCGHKFAAAKITREWASKGGKKSKRSLSPEQAKAMVEAREKKRKAKDAGEG